MMSCVTLNSPFTVAISVSAFPRVVFPLTFNVPATVAFAPERLIATDPLDA